jgi:DNA-binding GntR family transcriptional regulator
VTATELAAKNASDEEIAGISRAHEQCVRMLKAGDVLGHFRANVEMSEKIFQAAHNRPLLRLLGSIHKQALRYRYFAYRKSAAVRLNSVRYNADFVKALARRDGPEAAAKVRLSIETSHDIIRDCLLERAAAGAPRKSERRSQR